MAQRAESKKDQRSDVKDWLASLYAHKLDDETFIKQMFESFSYQGFNREEVIKQLRISVPDESLCVQVIVLVALRGPQVASKTKLLNGRTPTELGLSVSGGKGSKKLTLNKILAATADLAAHFMKKMNVPKRIDSELPAWLQFPSAGSIKLNSNLRRLHKEFSIKFSELIGGEFNEGIYSQMESNAYLEPSLKLFE